MTNLDSDSSCSPAETEKTSPTVARYPWLAGAMISITGAVIGALALGLFCYALGVNFQEEGWPETQAIDQTMLMISLAGFAIATLLFWVGFIRAAHARH